MKKQLKRAVIEECPEDVKSFLRNSGKFKQTANELGFLLHLTVNTEIARLLLDAGANPDVLNNRGETPLFSALRNNNCNVDFIQTLLDKNADVNAVNLNFCSPLHSLVETTNCRLDIIEKLLTRGANINMRNSSGETPLHIIARKRDVKMDIEEALETMVYIHRHEIRHITSKSKEIDFSLNTEQSFPLPLKIIELLFLHGADVNIPNNEEKTPLHIAVENPRFSPAVIIEMFNNGANIAAKTNTDRHTPLHLAMKNLNCTVDLITMLLNQGASLKEVDMHGNTALHMAVLRGLSVCVIRKLLNCGANINAQNSFLTTPLHDAIPKNSILLSELLKWSPDMNLKDDCEDTAFAFFVKCRYFDPLILNSMLQAGAEVNSVNDYLETPLHLAINNCVISQEHKRKTFLKRFGNVLKSITNKLSKMLQKSKLQLTILNKYVDNLREVSLARLEKVEAIYFIKALLQHGARIDTPAVSGNTPLRDSITNFRKKLDDGSYLAMLIKCVVWGDYESNSNTSILRKHLRYTCYEIRIKINNFIASCMFEITSLKSDKVSYDLTLFEFMKMETLSIDDYTDNKEVRKTIDGIFRRLLQNKYPIYSDMILDKIDSAILIHKMTCQQLFTVVNKSVSGERNKKIILVPDCIFNIMKYLSKPAILNLYFAFCDCILPKDLTIICAGNFVPCEFNDASTNATFSKTISTPSLKSSGTFIKCVTLRSLSIQYPTCGFKRKNAYINECRKRARFTKSNTEC